MVTVYAAQAPSPRRGGACEADDSAPACASGLRIRAALDLTEHY
jgi:hypothetical protein